MQVMILFSPYKKKREVGAIAYDCGVLHQATRVVTPATWAGCINFAQQGQPAMKSFQPPLPFYAH
jgi:hypothetical protein